MQQNNANEAHPVTERSYGARYNIVSSHDYKFCSPRHLRNIRVIMLDFKFIYRLYCFLLANLSFETKRDGTNGVGIG